VHFARFGDVADHSSTDFEAMTLAVEGAATYSGQHQFRALGVAEEQINFDAAQGIRNLIHDSGDEFFQV
jgi:hypothetical protein